MQQFFNTALTGYQEILTDPSYLSQIVTFTYPLIGNYGVSAEAMESDRVHARGVIMRDAKNTEDVATAEGAQRLIDAFGEIDVLVNNAGIFEPTPVLEISDEEWVRYFEVNVLSGIRLARHYLPGMVERGRGAVLNVASTAAFQPLPGQAAYGAGKAFVLSYTQSLAGELRGSGVTATALCPGPVETGFGERAGFTDEEAHNALPGIMWVDAADVARQAVAGLDKGKLVVIPGVANKVGAIVSQVTPRSLLLPLLVRSHPGLK